MRIVNPWLIYWITRFDTILTFAMVVAIISGIVTIICLIGGIVDDEEDIRKGLQKSMKICITICIVSSFIAVLVPSKQTCIEMMIADKVTYETVDAVKEAADYVVEKVKEVK